VAALYPNPAVPERIIRFCAKLRRWALLLLLVPLLGTDVSCSNRQRQFASTQKLDFNQDVQPILASHCFSCHGPDPEMRKAGLRLDLAEWGLKKRPDHPDAIVPGRPEKSELVKRIESHDPHYLMPQNAQGEAKPMKPEEIAILKEWIKEGAVYRPHWAFEKPTRPTLPTVARNSSWIETPIDAFILARMEKESLHPSPEADKETLIRRVTLDLTGLLPTPAEVKLFNEDTSPQAYEHLVDGLLSRPTFGEQRARYWLDYARYADTYGLHIDNSRDIWPYRDYLVRSFNNNKRFDQFAMEQIAGDMISAKNLDPLIGSGYVRLGISSNEGGTIPEELRVNIARERTEAYGATFMGLTVGCAVCHDHKYDPTTQKDFYSLSAFFNNMDEKPFNGDRPVWTPVVRIPKAQDEDAYNQVLAKRSELAERLRAMRAQDHVLVQRWLESGKDKPHPVAVDKLMLRLRLDERGGEVLKNSAPNANPAEFAIGKSKPQWGETTWLWPDFRMDTGTHILLGQTGDYEWNQAFSSGGWIMLRSAPNYTVENTSGALIAKMDTNEHNRGWDLSIQRGILSVRLVNEAPKEEEPNKAGVKKGLQTRETFHYPTPVDLTAKDLAPHKPPAKKASQKKVEKPAPPVAKDRTPKVAIEVSTVDPLPLDGEWKHVFFTYDGSGKASGVKIYVDGVPAATNVISDTLGKATIRTQAPMELGWRFPDASPARDTRYQDVRLYGRVLTVNEVKRLPLDDYVSEVTAKPTSEWNNDQWHAVSEFYLNSVDESYRTLLKQMTQLDAQLVRLSEGGDITLVAWEKPSLAYADVLTRGLYTARTERVEANTPHYLTPLPAGEPHNRLALAKWTVSPDNPLTARVTVNRMWYELFGTGLVETTEDFGIMGQRPSHPELLDWLAVEFRESGWNVKHMYKLMVMSDAYRQSAKSTPDQLAKDPKNLLLSHGPRFRMDAEMLRDVALQAGGLLVDKIGGPSVKPYQPANVWEQVSYPTSDTVNYVRDHGDALYRRSMYSYWKRMAIMPDMDAFDAPMRDAACTRRQRTDTPLQALVTMNDVQWVEAARALAQRAILEGGRQPGQRIDLLSEILLSHDARPQMATVLEVSLQEMQKHYAADPRAAHALVNVGEAKHNPSIPEPELAAWTMIASEMLNLDETLTK
jgi:mono/diheme cytochrome c family protein